MGQGKSYAHSEAKDLIKEYSQLANINIAEVFSKEHKNKFMKYFIIK